MRLPTQGEQIGIRQLLNRVTHYTAAQLTAKEEIALQWLSNDVLQAIDEGNAVEITIDVDATAPELPWCQQCPAAGIGRCEWYDLFDTPADGPNVLELDCDAVSAPELCPFRAQGRAVLIRRAT